MKLGIISDSLHFQDEQNRIYNLSILGDQFECWAELFDEVYICAPLLPGVPPETHIPYRSNNIRIIPIENAGGNSVFAKLNLIFSLKGWWKSINKLINLVDFIHIRCPNNISILGLIALKMINRQGQALYTGTWLGYPGESVTYRWQRWYLKHFFDGPVAVYGDWPDQPPHIVPSYSPSYPLSVWQEETETVEAKINKLKLSTPPFQPIQLITVGSLSKNKNQQLVIRAVKVLVEEGVPVKLAILGGGEILELLSELVQNLNLLEHVCFTGAVSHETVRAWYRQADFVIQAPYAEGFGKVPVEAFFHGTIPILSDVNLSSQLIGNGERGFCFPQDDPHAIADIVKRLLDQPAEMIRLIGNGREYARMMTLEAWQEHIRTMIENYWQIKLNVVLNEKS